MKKKYSKKETYIFSGPTYSNGLPHLGTLFNIILKDQIMKFNNLLESENKKLVHGFDMHGLPISNIVLKEKYNNRKPEDPLDFYLSCKKHAEKYSKLIEEEFLSFGVDKFDIYYTNNNDYIKKEIEIFRKLLEKQYISYDLKHIQICTSCQTSISFSEITKINKSTETFYIKLPVYKEENTFFLFWTTTWYSILFSQALCIDKNKTYCKVKKNEEYFYISERFFNLEKDFILLETLTGYEILKKKYKNIFFDEINNIYHMHTEEIGTEIINMSSDHSIVDYEVLKENNIFPRKNTINKNGTLNINNLILNKKEALNKINKYIFKIVDIERSIDSCDRCKKELVTIVDNQLFFNLEKNNLKEKCLQEISNIQNIPNNNSFFSTLQKRESWCISRQREWGVFIPSFQCNKCKKKFICKNILEKYQSDIEENGSICWLTKQYIPDYKCCDNSFTKLNETLDVWFDSGVAVIDKEIDIVIEGNDQYKGWFQVCLLISYALQEKKFSNKILCHGFIKDERKNKLSKSLKNFVDTKELKNKYNSDIIRMYVCLQDFKKDINYSEINLQNSKKEYSFFQNHFSFFIKHFNSYLENNNVENIYIDIKEDMFFILFFKEFFNCKYSLKEKFKEFNLHLMIREIKNFVKYSNKTFVMAIKKHVFKFSSNEIDNNISKKVFFFIAIYLNEMCQLIYPVLTDLSNIIKDFLKKNNLYSLNISNLIKKEQKDTLNIIFSNSDINLLVDSNINDILCKLQYIEYNKDNLMYFLNNIKENQEISL